MKATLEAQAQQAQSTQDHQPDQLYSEILLYKVHSPGGPTERAHVFEALDRRLRLLPESRRPSGLRR